MTVKELREYLEELEKEGKGEYTVRSYDDCEGVKKDWIGVEDAFKEIWI